MNQIVGRLIRVSMVVSLAGLLMGNKSCEKKPAAPEPRSLKKIVDVGQISSQPVKLPDGSVFDFQFVVNQQIYSVLFESQAFAFRYKAPVVGLSLASDGSVMSRLNMGKASMDFYEKTMGKPATQIVVPSKLAYCLFNKPQARISGAITSFELISGGGLSLGFNKLGEHAGLGIGANFDVDVYQLEMDMRAVTPDTGSTITSVTKRSNKSDYAGGLSLQIGPFSIGPSYYYNTPLAKVTRKTLEAAVQSIKDAMKDTDWFSRVLDYQESDDNLVAIIGGTNVGMQVGDQLAIYNEITYWTDEPCNSQVSHEGGALGTPVAIMQVSDVSPEISSGHFIEVYEDFNPAYMPGAKVKVHKLKSPDQPGISNTTKQ